MDNYIVSHKGAYIVGYAIATVASYYIGGYGGAMYTAYYTWVATGSVTQAMRAGTLVAAATFASNYMATGNGAKMGSFGGTHSGSSGGWNQGINGPITRFGVGAPGETLVTAATPTASIMSNPFLGTHVAEAVYASIRDVTPEAVDQFALTAFALYGPQSSNQEHFGFIYLLNGHLDSTHIAGHACPAGGYLCEMSTSEVRAAKELIPRGALVIGEWHTHPYSNGSDAISDPDATSAFNIWSQIRDNFHRDLYYSYYSDTHRRVWRWNPRSRWLPDARGSKVQVGSYEN